MESTNQKVPAEVTWSSPQVPAGDPPKCAGFDSHGPWHSSVLVK